MEENKNFIDLDKVEEERRAREEAQAQNWHEYNEKLEKETNPLGKELIKAYNDQRQAEEEKLKAKMEAEIEEARREAEERIKAKYKADYHRSEWNENESDKGLRDLVKKLFKKG